MKFNKMLFVGIFSMALLSGCSIFNQEKDVVQVSPLPKVENQFTAKKVWDVSVGQGTGRYYSKLAPVSQGNVLYVASRNGLVAALDIETGKTLWQINLAEKSRFFSTNKSALLSGGVTIANDMLYIGSEHAELYALKAKSGELIWQSQASGELLSKPVVSDGKVLVHSSNGVLQAFNAVNGQPDWRVNLEGNVLTLRGESAPAIAHGAAIVGSDNGRVGAYFLDQGQLIWQQNVASVKGASEIARLSDIDMTPVIIDNTIYVASYNGGVSALDLGTGKPLWHRDYSTIHNFAIDRKTLYFVDQNDVVMSLSSQTGLSNWRVTDLMYRRLTAPALMGRYVVVADSLGYVHWMNKSSGLFVSQQLVDKSGFLATPLVVNNKLILQAKNGRIYSLVLP